MILVDANLLVYVKAADVPQHARAKSWFEQAVRDGARIGLPWQSLLGFVRLITSARVCSQPLSIAQAWEQVEEWLALPGVWIPAPTDQHARVLGELLLAANAGGNLVPDAHLAAIALEHGLVVCSSDADFARFPGVRWVNPLSGSVMERAVSLGKAVSDLIRRGLDAGATGSPKRSLGVFPVFEAGRGAAPLSLEDVQRHEDEA